MANEIPEDTVIERSCPECGGRLQVKTNRATGHQFLGCERWSAGCGYTEKIPESLRMRLAGAPQLPGLE